MYSAQDGQGGGAYRERHGVRDLDEERDLSAKRVVTPRQRRPSIGKRIFRTVSRFFLAVFLGVAATLGWQSYGDEAREMVSAWSPSLGQLLPASTTQSAAAASTSPRLVQQLEPMARDLAVVRRSLEQLAANQEQMAVHIASLNAAERPSFSIPSWAVPILPSNSPQSAAKQPLILNRVGSR